MTNTDNAADDEFDTDAPPSTTISDMVRDSPIGAIVGAFIAGYLVSKIL